VEGSLWAAAHTALAGAHSVHTRLTLQQLSPLHPVHRSVHCSWLFAFSCCPGLLEPEAR